MKTKIFEFKRTTDAVLSEHFDTDKFFFEYNDGESVRLLNLYTVNENKKKYDRLYLGHSLEEILDSGRDILGEELTKDGDPDYESLRGVMPEITEDAYCFLGGAASHGSVTVDRFGVITPQLSGRDREPKPMFRPSYVDERLSDVTPRQCLAGGRFPVLFNVFSVGEENIELMYFADAADPDRDPVIWIRKKSYNREKPESFSLEYSVATFAHDLPYNEKCLHSISSELLYDALASTVAYWLKFTESGARIALPEQELVRVTEGAMISAATTFTGQRPHYGHKYYGKELHDNFPPNYIWSIETACLTGHEKWARKIFEHMLDYALTDEGCFAYRQGKLMLGSSATEYGMLLWLAKRYEKILMQNGADKETLEKLSGMGNIILAHCIECPEFDGLTLVKMCAEADNNVRVNVYLNNNLWSIRGLEALSQLLRADNENKYLQTAIILRKNINLMIETYGVKSSDFGDIPPFRFGYPAIPLTLSNCLDSSAPMTEAEREKYFATTKGRRNFDVTDQEITENTYANYRYYPESLSAMLLPKNYADGVEEMRERIGGNLLGMTRFRSWLDDWPVLNYARFLIETGRIEKYLLLLYAHTQHHGHPDLMCYYEQIKLFGKVSANDCVPSLLTTPAMVAWIFAYERVADNVLMLLAALPKKWYSLSFQAKKIGYSGGTVDIVSDGNRVTVDFSSPSPDGCELVWRAKDKLTLSDVLVGKEFISEIRNNKIILKSGITHAEFEL